MVSGVSRTAKPRRSMSLSTSGRSLSWRCPKKPLSTCVVVRRIGRGAAPFEWEILTDMERLIHASPARFGRMDAAYTAGAAQLPEFIPKRSAPPGGHSRAVGRLDVTRPDHQSWRASRHGNHARRSPHPTLSARFLIRSLSGPAWPARLPDPEPGCRVRVSMTSATSRLWMFGAARHAARWAAQVIVTGHVRMGTVRLLCLPLWKHRSGSRWQTTPLGGLSSSS